MSSRKFTIAGAVLGLALYVLVGALPALVYGGYAGVALVGWLFGTPVQVSLASRAIVLFAMGSGVVLVGAMFVIGGAVAGTAIGLLAGKPGAADRSTRPNE